MNRRQLLKLVVAAVLPMPVPPLLPPIAPPAADFAALLAELDIKLVLIEPWASNELALAA